MTEPSSPDEWFPLEELTERLAELVWIERSVAELLAGWSQVDADDQACGLFAEAAAHHRWHAEIVEAVLPTCDALADRCLPRPPTAQWLDVIDTLTQLRDPDRTVVRLAAVVREIDPWLVRECDALEDLARPVADAALRRWLGFVGVDHHDDGLRFAALLDSLASNTVDLADHTVLASIRLPRPEP